MNSPFNGGTCLNSASLSTERKLNKKGSTNEPHFENVANTDTGNCIGCTEEDKPMQTEMKSTLSRDDVQYIRNLLAEGIARMLVEKVAKSSDLAVDKLEPEHYNPPPQKGGTSI